MASGKRKERYMLDVDDVLQESFFTKTNSERLIDGVNESEAETKFVTAVGGTNNDTFIDGKFLVYNATTKKITSSDTGADDVNDFPVNDYYTKDALAALFDGIVDGKMQVSWDEISDKPTLAAWTDLGAQQIPVPYAVLTFAHSLGAFPSSVDVVLKCRVLGDGAYLVGDEVPFTGMIIQNDSDVDFLPGVTRTTTSVLVNIARTGPAMNYWITAKAGDAYVNITLSRWDIRVRVMA